ncbi:hypothetical protein LZ32DRAFT_113196 [Colletotrichum eremochloae]|nr:hypothetical protein LZ32DRAFT_113196 [Colletotrichum eremochloae]
MHSLLFVRLIVPNTCFDSPFVFYMGRNFLNFLFFFFFFFSNRNATYGLGRAKRTRGELLSSRIHGSRYLVFFFSYGTPQLEAYDCIVSFGGPAIVL